MSAAGVGHPQERRSFSKPLQLAMTLARATLGYDAVGNPVEISDERSASEWPARPKPVARSMRYDDAYHLTVFANAQAQAR